MSLPQDQPAHAAQLPTRPTLPEHATRRIFRLQAATARAPPGDSSSCRPSARSHQREREAILQSLARIEVRPQVYNKVERIVTPEEPALIQVGDELQALFVVAQELLKGLVLQAQEFTRGEDLERPMLK
jgi:hypothetical protein